MASCCCPSRQTSQRNFCLRSRSRQEAGRICRRDSVKARHPLISRAVTATRLAGFCARGFRCKSGAGHDTDPDHRLSSATSAATSAATPAPTPIPAPAPIPTASATPPLRFGRRHGRSHHAAGDDDGADGIHAKQDAGRHHPRHHVANGAACFAFCHIESP